MLHNRRVHANGTPDEVFNSTDPLVQQFIHGISDPKEVTS
jgi:ABC-type transporter Mla maintaining outer membrane lipid asymmetry ATPase subunit MlaF